MEFPDLGEHCSEKSCKQLDFLPLKCDACKEIFCKDHIAYSRHKCSSHQTLFFSLIDFLPLKCDACKEIFCKDHIAYSRHKCSSAYKKDIQVPVCPLCNTPVPVRKGEMPDVVVGAHMDRDCKRDSGRQQQKIFTNRCFKPGCRKREMMKLVCDQCHGNFCLHHRHPLDHDCKGPKQALSKAGCAALMRSLESNSVSRNCQLLQNGCKLQS